MPGPNFFGSVGLLPSVFTTETARNHPETKRGLLLPKLPKLPETARNYPETIPKLRGCFRRNHRNRGSIGPAVVSVDASLRLHWRTPLQLAAEAQLPQIFRPGDREGSRGANSRAAARRGR
jgi:hypothetical protein